MSAVPPTWTLAAMGEICDIVSGSTPRTSDPENWGGPIPWITPDDLSGYAAKFIDGGRRSLTEKGYRSCSAQLVPVGTVMYTSRAPIGYVAIAARPVCTNQGFKSFVPPDGVLSDYIFWYLKYATPEIRKMGSGTTFLEISKKRAESIPIPIAPTAEQRRIVATIEEHFSRIDSGVEALQRARRNLERMRAAVLQAAVMGQLAAQDSQDEPAAAMLKRAKIDPLRDANFPPLPASWEWVRFGDLLLLLRNGIFVSRPTNEPGGIPILRISAVRPLRVNLEDVRYLPRRTSPKDLQPFFIANEDLLFTRYSGNPEFVGACAMVRQLSKPMLHPDKLIRAVVNKGIGVPGFLELATSAGHSRDHIRHRRRTTAGQTGISGGDLKNMPVPLPPLAEQARIAQEVDRQFSITFAVARVAEDSLRLSTSLRRTILDTAFRGSLVPQDPSDEPASVLLELIRAADTAGKSTVRRSHRSSRR